MHRSRLRYRNMATVAALLVVAVASCPARAGWIEDRDGKTIIHLKLGELPDATRTANWASSIALLGLASVVYPQAIQRIYAARSGQALKRSFALMAYMPLTTTLVVTLIGIAAIPRIADLSGVGADEVMPLVLSAWAEARWLRSASGQHSSS